MVMVEKAIMRSADTEETTSADTQRPAELEDVHKYPTHNSQQQGGRILRLATQLWKLHQTKLYFYREQMPIYQQG